MNHMTIQHSSNLTWFPLAQLQPLWLWLHCPVHQHVPVFWLAICLWRAAFAAACWAGLVTGVVLSLGGAPCFTVLVARAVLSGPPRLILLVGTGDTEWKRRSREADISGQRAISRIVTDDRDAHCNGNLNYTENILPTESVWIKELLLHTRVPQNNWSSSMLMYKVCICIAGCTFLKFAVECARPKCVSEYKACCWASSSVYVLCVWELTVLLSTHVSMCACMRMRMR